MYHQCSPVRHNLPLLMYRSPGIPNQHSVIDIFGPVIGSISC